MKCLFNFQNEGVEFLKSRKYALLAYEQGLGKTIMAIVASEQAKIDTMLIICPASVKYNWQRELNEWRPGIPSFVVEGKSCLIPVTDVTIINYDLIHSKGILVQLLNRQYDLVVADESHFLKNSRAKRTKSMYSKGGIVDTADKVWLMTGTPVLNRPVELFPMLRKFMPERLGKFADYMNYTKKFCNGYMGRFGWDDRGASNIDELADILGGFMLRRLKREVMKDLPDKMYQKIILEQTKAAKPAIKKEKSFYEDTKDNLLGDLATERRLIGMEKLPQIVSHIENLLEEKDKLVVFGHHRDVLRQLKETFIDFTPVLVYGGLTSKQKQQAVDDFVNKPENRLFLGQIDSAGVGIDGLQKVADTVVFAEISWVPGKVEQAIDRCHRIGQKNKVLVQFLIMKGSIDEQILDAMLAKSKVIKKIVKDEPLTEEEVSTMAEKKYTIEENLERIANTLERIEGKLDVPDTGITETTADVPQEVQEPKPVKPKKEKGISTPTELLKYFNGVILPMKDKAAAKSIVTKVMSLIKDETGYATIADMPKDPDVLARAKEIFDNEVANG